jgi:hypothetical protein
MRIFLLVAMLLASCGAREASDAAKDITEALATPTPTEDPSEKRATEDPSEKRATEDPSEKRATEEQLEPALVVVVYVTPTPIPTPSPEQVKAEIQALLNQCQADTFSASYTKCSVARDRNACTLDAMHARCDPIKLYTIENLGDWKSWRTSNPPDLTE